MKITKYEQSCLDVTAGSSRLIIDPGSFLATIPDATGIDAIVFTHEHTDHFSPDRVRDLLDSSPDARLFGPSGVANVASAAEITVEVVHAGDTVEVGDLSLAFFGGVHNEIHSSIPLIDNLGVLVDGRLYYGGDSYSVPDVAVEILAAPVGAPWLKIGEAMDYVLAVAPRLAFPVHDMTLSVAGKELGNARLQWATEQGGGTYQVLEPGESIDR